MKIILIRHGQTDWNKQERVQGSSDIPLNDTGIAQAYKTKQMLDDYEFDIVISSPLERARQTAGIVCKDRANEIIVNKGIAERDFGNYEGKSYRSDFSYQNGAWSLSMEEQLESVEAYPLFYARVAEFLDDIIEKYHDKTVLLVAHGGVSIAIGQYFLGIPEGGHIHDYILDNCAVAEYDDSTIKGKV